MVKQGKASKEAEAIKKLDESALLAQERITKAADKAQQMIDDACTAATKALETSSRVPDKRNLNGSFQWDRGDRYRRGSDDRLERVEDKINNLNTAKGLLEVGQAKREEQIAGLLDDCAVMREDIHTLRTEFGDMSKEMTSRTTTLREFILEIRDGFTKELDAYKSRNLWQLVLVLATAITTIVFLIVNKFIQI
jgi:hypothetical protein